MGIATTSVDGNDLWAVRKAAAKAIEHARSGHGPAFLETLTYRFVGHSRSDPGKYRKPGELERWRERDPLLVGRDRLRRHHGVGDERIDEIDTEVVAEMAAIVESSLGSPFPDPARAGSEFKNG